MCGMLGPATFKQAGRVAAVTKAPLIQKEDARVCRPSNAVWHWEDSHGVDLNRHLLSILSCGSTLELRRQNKGDCR